jgi:acetyltransferase-like isoleucine patch superfamily enzyme
MKTIRRFLLLPFGFILKLFEYAKDGARDIDNRIRFKKAKIDSGCCINEKSEISSNTHLLSNCYVNNSKIDSYTYIGKNCIIQNTSIGKYCSIANDVLIGLGKHPTDLISTSTLFYRRNNTLDLHLVTKDYDFEEYKEINIGNDVWIGARSILMDGIIVGTGAIIAANSVVTKDVPDYAIVAGIPAKIIRYRFHEEKIQELLKMEWWSWEFEELQKRIDELNKY